MRTGMRIAATRQPSGGRSAATGSAGVGGFSQSMPSQTPEHGIRIRVTGTSRTPLAMATSVSYS